MTDNIKYYYLNMDTKQLCETENDLLEYFRNRSGARKRVHSYRETDSDIAVVIVGIGTIEFTDASLFQLLRQIKKGASSGPSWKERVIQEKRELDEKIARLQSFMHATLRPDIEGELLLEQLDAMLRYGRILEKRINRF